MNCAVDASAAEQGAICGVHDCVDVEGCDVGFENFNSLDHLTHIHFTAIRLRF
jgi:hypothetical protein